MSINQHNPSPWMQKTVQRWLEQNLLAVIEDSEVVAQVVTNLPFDVGRGSVMKIHQLTSIDLAGMKLRSLHQSLVYVEVQTQMRVGIDVSWEEYQSSQEVRDFVGETEEEFISTSVMFDTSVGVVLDLELLKEPPMVIKHFLRKISGPSTDVEFNEGS